MKHIRDAEPCLGGGLEEVVQILLFHAADGLGLCHLPQILPEVNTIANQVDEHIVSVHVFFDFMKPIANMLERVFLCDIIDDQSGLAIFVEVFGDGPELFLPGCVPNLQLDNGFAIDPHNERAKLHAYGDLMIGFESALCEHLHQAALADAGIPDDNHFEEAVRVNLLVWVLFNGLSRNRIQFFCKRAQGLVPVA